MVDNPENPSPNKEETANQSSKWDTMASPEQEQPETPKKEIRIKDQEQNSIKQKVITDFLPDGTYFHGTVEEYNEAVREYLKNNAS